MCNRFLQYLEKKFSCFGQDVNDEYNSTAEGSDQDDEDHNSSLSENDSSERESFKSYSDNDEESAAEEVVESTGRSGTRDSSYEDCYSKSIGSTSNSIRNVESLKSFDRSSRKNSQAKINCIPAKIKSKVGNVKINQEILEKTSKSDIHHSKQIRQQPEPERRKLSSETATTTLPKEKFTKKNSQSKSSLKAPTVKDNNISTKKDDRKSAAGKQDHAKTTVREKKSLQIIDNKSVNKSNHQELRRKPDGKVKEKLERERKSTPNEKRKTEEIKKTETNLETAVRKSKKSMSNNTKLDSVPLHNKTVANKKLEPRMPKNGLKTSNINRAGTFSKRTKILPAGSVPKFTSKSIQKRKPRK